MNKNTRIIYNKLDEFDISNQKYIDLSDVKIQGQSDIVNMCNIFRDPRYETFRIFYMQDDKIVGQEALTSRIPNAVLVFDNDKRSPIRICNKMKNRMERLCANGYYLAHNHASESAKPSKDDMKLTRYFASNVKGFLGHVVLNNSDKYSFIANTSEGLLFLPEEKNINKDTLTKIDAKIKNNSIYDIKISCLDDLVGLLKQMQDNKEYSTIIMTDSRNNIRMVLEMSNKMLNQDLKSFNGYIKNLARNTGSIRIFIGTNNSKAYYKSIEHQKYGTFKDTVYIDIENNKIISEKIENSPDLFDNEQLKKRKKARDAR